MTQVQDAVARMEHRQGTTLEKIVEDLDDKLKKLLDERIKEAVPKKEPSPAPEDKFRSAEDLDKAQEEDARLEHERATALFAHYQEQLRSRQDEDSRQTLVVMTALQQELEALKIDRNQERETAKNQCVTCAPRSSSPLDQLNRQSHPEPRLIVRNAEVNLVVKPAGLTRDRARIMRMDSLPLSSKRHWRP
jgi:hypothetical protein